MTILIAQNVKIFVESDRYLMNKGVVSIKQLIYFNASA